MGITKKTLMITASAALTVATAVPALALENEFHGMFRLKGVVNNFNATPVINSPEGSPYGFYLPAGIDKDAPTATYLEQRARLMYIAKANDDLKLVTHFEIDSRWGDASYTNSRNKGGAIGADTVNLETKSVYLDFNCPITGANVKVGMQPYDDAFKGVLFGADMAGLLVSRSFGPLDASAGFFRFDDSGLPGKRARDMVAATARYAVTKDIKVGGAYYFIGDDRSETDTFVRDYLFQQQGETNTFHNLGINAEANLGPVTIDGFFLYQFGTLEDIAAISGRDRDVSAFAGNVGARGKIGPGTARAEFLYVSGDTGGGSSTNSFQSIQDEHGFYNGNLQLLFRDAYAMTIDNAVVYTSNNKDQGVIAGFLGYDLPITSKLSSSFNAGFASVAKENRNTTLDTSNGKYLGTEVNASVDYKLFDNMTASVRGAYVILGDYFNDVAEGGKDPDDPYMGSVILNYAF
ncbi:hypothetical protein [Geobacter sp.]|uniref:hypothetical protein n=1 Tax=Geobacter sp. TaxID=46610 RepID=UPI0027BAFC50|nr:hypothetical protein [Geobacter sp.]